MTIFLLCYFDEVTFFLLNIPIHYWLVFVMAPLETDGWITGMWVVSRNDRGVQIH